LVARLSPLKSEIRLILFLLDRINRIYWIFFWLSACPPCEQGEAGGDESQKFQSPSANEKIVAI
jgi:hypothetical protein